MKKKGSWKKNKQKKTKKRERQSLKKKRGMHSGLLL
jgi:hypothetical protein